MIKGIIRSIQLGATVDYAILFTERYKENRQTSFFDFGDKKRPSTFRTLRPVNGLIFCIEL